MQWILRSSQSKNFTSKKNVIFTVDSAEYNDDQPMTSESKTETELPGTPLPKPPQVIPWRRVRADAEIHYPNGNTWKRTIQVRYN